MASHRRSDAVLTDELMVKTFKKRNSTRISWKSCEIVLNSSGKLYKDGEKSPIVSITQQTKVFNSEFREFCFVVCTPGEKKVTFAAENEDQKLKWMEAIEKSAKEAPPIHVKLVLVGDDKELQQSFLNKFFMQCGQTELANDVLNFAYKSDNIELTLNLDVTGEKVKLMLCCVSEEDYPKLRVLNYVDANAILLCFSTTDHKQFEGIEKTWFPEVNPSIKKGASLFLIGLKEKEEERPKEVIEAVIGEELANFMNGTYFNVDLELNENNKDIVDVDSVNGDVDDDSSAGPTFFSPGDTFLEVLQNTLEDSREGYIDDGESAATDVANLNDFSNLNFGTTKKKSTFLQYVKQKTSKGLTRLASRKQLFPSRAPRASFRSEDGISIATSKKTSVSIVLKLKLMLKNLKPKRKAIVDDKPKLAEEAMRDAHFVSRAQTGSLIFLGEHMLDDPEEDD